MRRLTRFVCLLLVLSLTLAIPVSAKAEENARGSAFFAMHDAYLAKTGQYKFDICFKVLANAAIMDVIGVSEIEVYCSMDNENWTYLTTYTMEDYPQLVDDNTGGHGGSITHNFAYAKYYKAYLTFYAKDSRGTGKLFRYTNSLQMF